MTKSQIHLLTEQSSGVPNPVNDTLSSSSPEVPSHVQKLVRGALEGLSSYTKEMRQRDIEVVKNSKCIIVLTGLSGAGKTTMRKKIGELDVGKIVTSLVTRELRGDEKGIMIGGRALTKQLKTITPSNTGMIFTEQYMGGNLQYDLNDAGQYTLIADVGDQGAMAIYQQKEQIKSRYGASVIQVWLTTPSANFDASRFDGKSSNTAIYRLQPDELARYIPVEKNADIHIPAYLSLDQVADYIIRDVAQKLTVK